MKCGLRVGTMLLHICTKMTTKYFIKGRLYESFDGIIVRCTKSVKVSYARPMYNKATQFSGVVVKDNDMGYYKVGRSSSTWNATVFNPYETKVKIGESYFNLDKLKQLLKNE